MTKMKDGRTGEQMASKTRQVMLPHDRKGIPRTSVVLDAAELPTKAAPARLTKGLATFKAAVRAAIDQWPVEHGEHKVTSLQDVLGQVHGNVEPLASPRAAAQPELRKNPTNPTVFRVIRLLKQSKVNHRLYCIGRGRERPAIEAPESGGVLPDFLPPFGSARKPFGTGNTW